MEWTVNEAGPRAVIDCRRPDDGAGLYKAYLRGSGGRCLLGTLTPENGLLRLQRTLSIDSLIRQGTWPIARIEEELAFPFHPKQKPPSDQWQPMTRAEDLFTDKLLRQSADTLTGALVRRQQNGFTLALPFLENAPFPLLPVFCFARVETMDARAYILFSFDCNGCPKFPYNPN